MTNPVIPIGTAKVRRELSEEAIVQVEGAVDDLQPDASPPLRFPYLALDNLAGSIPKGRVIVVAANTGQGKTTFLLDLVDRWADAERTVYMLGLEQNPKELRTKWACLRADVHAAIAFEKRWGEFGTMGDVMRERVADEFMRQQEPPYSHRVIFDPAETVSHDRLIGAADYAREAGADVMIVDYIGRIDHGTGQNSYRDFAKTCQLVSRIADEMSLTMLVASQLNREASKGDRLAKYQPPQLHHLHGGGVIEHEADVVLGLYRPLATPVDKEKLAAVRAGVAEPLSVLMPNTMAVCVMKHRLRGEHEGRRCYLSVHHGRLSSDEAATHGIRTNRDLGRIA